MRLVFGTETDVEDNSREKVEKTIRVIYILGELYGPKGVSVRIERVANGEEVVFEEVGE